MNTVVKGRNYTDQTDETQSTLQSFALMYFFSFPLWIPSLHFISLLYFGQHTNSAADTFLFDLNKNDPKFLYK